ncbi:MAG TPA: hypothetical protein VF806_09260 [Anaerolineaceae bacterium]
MESLVELSEKKRLIVFVPDYRAENLELAHKAHWIAMHHRYDVLFLALVDTEDEMLGAARMLATLKAVTSENWLTTTSRVVTNRDWLTALQEIYQPGDAILCHAEQVVKNGFLTTLPLNDYLRDHFEGAVYTLSGYYQPRQVQVRRWLHSLLFWIGCLVIFAGFSALEMQLDLHTLGITRTLTMVIVVLFEFGAIWVWSGISS